MNYKRIIAATLLATFTITAGVSTAEASWLSKNWNKLNKALGIDLEGNTSSDSDTSSGRTEQQKTSTVRLPRESDYPKRYPTGKVVGTKLDERELSVAGVPIHAPFEAIKASLGEPTKQEIRPYYGQKIRNPNDLPGGFLQYGGLRFIDQATIGGSAMTLDGDVIEITNRDAETMRGISVGDSLEKVYGVYGRPDSVDETYHTRWLYGTFIRHSDFVRGIYFYHDGIKVTKIMVVDSSH